MDIIYNNSSVNRHLSI